MLATEIEETYRVVDANGQMRHSGSCLLYAMKKMKILGDGCSILRASDGTTLAVYDEISLAICRRLKAEKTNRRILAKSASRYQYRQDSWRWFENKRMRKRNELIKRPAYPLSWQPSV